MMKSQKLDLNRKTLYILSFCIPVLMMLVFTAVLKIYPFGDNTILYNDATNQMVEFYSYLRSMIFENNDSSYTLSKFMGGDMAGFTGYYLTNPLLLVLLLFSNRMMPVAMLVLTIIHIGAFGLSCFHFLDVKSGVSLGALIFSTGYAFMGIVFAYVSLPIFFMAFLLAPVVAAGIVKLVRGIGQGYEYIFALAFMVICNFYQGYMTCFFAVFYFIYLVIKEGFYIEETTERDIRKAKRNHLLRLCVKFILSSITAIAISAINLIPVVMSLTGTKNGIDLGILYPKRDFRFLNVFSQFYTNAFIGNLSNSAMPYVYVGFVAFVCFVLYFFNRNISKKDRVAAMVGILFILGCSYISTIDIILHGFNIPEGFAHRYSFLISLFVVDIAYESFLHIFENSRNHKNEKTGEIKNAYGKETFFGIGVCFLIYSVYAYKFGGIGLSWWSVLWDVALATIVMFFILYTEKNQNFITVVVLILVGLQCIDLTENAIWSMPMDEVDKMSDYVEYYDRVSPIISDIKSYDKGLYRIEKDFQWSHNDSMLFNYNGLTHYSSCEKDYVESFAQKMGFRNSEVWTFYNQGSTSFIDSLLGMKYFISVFDTTDKPFSALGLYDEAYVYENPYALPIMIPVHSDFSKVDMNSNNLFEIQNEIVHEFGVDEDILTTVDIEDIALTNVRKVTYVDSDKESGEHNNSENSGLVVTRYERVDSDNEAYIEYILRPQENDNLYLYFDAPHEQYTEIYVNDAYFDDYFTDWRWNILKIGKYPKETEVHVKLTVNDDGLDISDPYFYIESEDVLRMWYEKVTAEKTNLNKISSSHFEGSAILNVDGYLMLTLPKEKGWNINIDGKRTKYTEALGALIIVPVQAGEHVIDMKYIPPGRNLGVIITTITVIILFLINILHASKK